MWWAPFYITSKYRVQKSVGLDEVHVFQELNDRALYPVLGCRTIQISPHLVQLSYELDRLDCRKGLLHCFSPRLTSSLALGYWSLRMDLMVSNLFSYHWR